MPFYKAEGILSIDSYSWEKLPSITKERQCFILLPQEKRISLFFIEEVARKYNDERSILEINISFTIMGDPNLLHFGVNYPVLVKDEVKASFDLTLVSLDE